MRFCHGVCYTVADDLTISKDLRPALHNSELAIRIHPLNILWNAIEGILHRPAKVHKPLQNLLLKSRVPEQLICCIVNRLLLKWRKRNAVIQPCITSRIWMRRFLLNLCFELDNSH